jgi:hypothetical protein
MPCTFYGLSEAEVDSNTEINVRDEIRLQSISVITKLPNSEQSYKGKVKTHKYINRQNQSTTGKL